MQQRTLHNVLVTGGAGFIGCNFIRYLLDMINTCNGAFGKSGFDGIVVNVDALTYAGNLESLADVERVWGGKRYFFEKADICNGSAIRSILSKYDIDTIVHFAAESHVDRSILGPGAFIKTNITGTFTLLEASREYWKKADGSVRQDVLFHHISTDEVYGSLENTGKFTETTPYDPKSPYSASKAASDHLVMAYNHTYGLPVTLSNCSNNYGPYQFPEKLLPLMICNIKERKPLPVYGDGSNIRDWIYVGDHNSAVWLVMKNGMAGQKYNIGGENEWRNIDLLRKLILIVSNKIGVSVKEAEKNITYISDRPGHDKRYAIDCSKIKTQLMWKRQITFDRGLEETVEWYLTHEDWVNHVRTGDYTKWLERNYHLSCAGRP